MLEEVEDLGGGKVYAVLGLYGQSKDGGGTMETHFYDVFTIQNGLILRLEEYATPDEALGAAGVEL